MSQHERYRNGQLAKGQIISWTDANVAKLLRLAEDGLSCRLIAIQMRTTKNSVLRKLHTLGKREKSKAVKWTDKLDAELIHLRSLGLTRPEIAAKLGISMSSCMARVAKLIAAGKLVSQQNAPDQARKSGVTFRFAIGETKAPRLDFDAEIRVGEGKSFADLRRRDCRYPLGADRWCAEPAIEGKSYCERCYAIVYTPYARRAA